MSFEAAHVGLGQWSYERHKISRRLPKNAIVKWDEYHEWRDSSTLEPHATVEVRYAVVPDAFAAQVDPRRSFVQCVTLDASGNEREVYAYQCFTFAARADGFEQIHALWEEIEAGTVRLHLKREGMSAMPLEIGEKTSFVEFVRWQALWRNIEYSMTQEAGEHPSNEQILAAIETLKASEHP